MFKIAHLYPKDLNLYGDQGNILYLQYFLNSLGIESQVSLINKGDSFDDDYDFIFSGGGPDSLQNKIYSDFLNKRALLIKHFELGKPAVFVCGSFQLLGKYYLTSKNEKILGLDIFNFHTRSPNNQKRRIVGNTFFNSNNDLSNIKVVGFENHNGRTYLGDGTNPLGFVSKKNSGNNDTDYTEGLLYKKTIGTYMHGPLFVKNTDLLIFLLQNYLLDLKINPDLKKYYPELIAKQNVLNKKN